jgi:hypothetical protein
MKINLILALLICTSNQIAVAQNTVIYQGRHYQARSTTDPFTRTVSICPFDEQKFKEKKGKVVQKIKGQIVELDFNNLSPSELTSDEIKGRYMSADPVRYRDIVKMRDVYIGDELKLIDEVSLLIPQFMALDKMEPRSDAEKALLYTIAGLGYFSKDDDIKYASEKATKENKFSKKLITMADLLAVQLETEKLELLELRRKRDDLMAYLTEGIPFTAFFRESQYPKNESWAKPVTVDVLKPITVKVQNPFLKSSIKVRNVNFVAPDPEIGEYEVPGYIGLDDPEHYAYRHSYDDYIEQYTLPSVFKSKVGATMDLDGNMLHGDVLGYEETTFATTPKAVAPIEVVNFNRVRYNENGQIIFVASNLENVVGVAESVLAYNDQGQLLSATTFKTAYGNLLSTTVKRFNYVNGRLDNSTLILDVKKQRTQPVLHKRVYQYTNDRLVKTQSMLCRQGTLDVLDSCGVTAVYHYRSNGNLQEIEEYNEGWGHTYAYDATGINAVNVDDALHEYDVKTGLLKKVVESNGSVSTTTYKFDTMGNWVEKTVHSICGPCDENKHSWTRVTRQIDYRH